MTHVDGGGGRSDPDDTRDLSLAARGDMRAFERLYRRHAAYIHRLAWRMVGAGDVDDAVQDVFIRVWAKANSYRGEAAFRTWLHRLALNVLLRRAANDHNASQRRSELDMTVAARPEPTDERLDVETALETLSPEFRAAIVLHDLEGYSHAETAELLGISVSAARMRLHRARTALKTLRWGREKDDD